ncbi:MAG: hypothetical protein GEU88_05110 [Solirubrobacterales bacterium]|nr:hypothetical protein [Solirubrobacterales bacterium]
MIVRTWGGRVPLEHEAGFHQHLLATGVADCRRRSGCLEVQVWRRRDEDGWVRFLLISWWQDRGVVRQYAGGDAETAVLYPGDERFGLVPDTTVTHYELVSEQAGSLTPPSRAAAP